MYILEAGRMYTYACMLVSMRRMCPSYRHYDAKPAHMRGDYDMWAVRGMAAFIPYVSLSAIDVASSAIVPRFVPHARVDRGNTRAHKAHAHA